MDKNAKPRKIPTNKDEKLELFLNDINRNNKDKDQNNNNGVSVEIINPPKEAAGVNIQIRAATFPELDPNTNFAVPHKTKEMNRCIMGEKSLTAHSSFPKINVENEIIHAIIGGLVKYPKSKFLDQCQYCASSTESSIGDTCKEYILKIVIVIRTKKTTGVFIKV